MSEIKDQVHGKFKLFSGKLDDNNQLTSLAQQVESWVRGAKVAPKSIGVEYLEANGHLLLSVGYRDDEAPYEVSLTCSDLGKLIIDDAATLAKLEGAMSEAGAHIKNVICHELCITKENDFLMVFMSHRAA